MAGMVPMLMLLAQAAAPEPGVYTNEEEVSFAREADRPPAPWTGYRIERAGAGLTATAVDAFGQPLGSPQPITDLKLAQAAPGQLSLALPPGGTTLLRRARAFTCWASILKPAAKPDGSEDWTFQRGLLLHDGGGRVRAGGDTPQAVLRMRNVVWPAGNRNRPSLVLYVHRPDDPDRAVSYSWADPAAKLIGINLRWMQGSCTLVEDGR